MSPNIKMLTSKFQTRNPFELAKCLGIIVIYSPLTDVKGFCQCIKRTKFIYISDQLDENEQQFVCAHELGHLLLHGGVNRYFMSSCTQLIPGRYEREADQFAVDLLWSDEELREYQDWTIPQIAVKLGISERLAEYRMLSVIPKFRGYDN